MGRTRFGVADHLAREEVMARQRAARARQVSRSAFLARAAEGALEAGRR